MWNEVLTCKQIHSTFTPRRVRGRLRFALLALVGAVLFSSFAGSAWAGFPMPFPARGDYLDELGFSAYYSTGGHTPAGSYGNGYFPLDFGIVTFHDSEWIGYDPDGDPGNVEDHLIYGAPLYSPVDGVVVSCWRNWPDEAPCPSGSECLTGGNHLNILTEDGEHVVYLAHLKPDTIPESFCPTTDPGSFPPSGSETCGLGAGWEGFSDAIRTDNMPGGSPTVRKGDYIGLAGSSRTTSPHLHLHVKEFAYDDATPPNPCQRAGVFVEIDFTESWHTEREESDAPGASDWLTAHETALPVNSSGWPRVLVWPDPVGPRLDDHVFGTSHWLPYLANVTDSEGGVLAFRNEDEHLEIHSYVLSGGDIDPRDDVEEGTVYGLDLARPFTDSRDIVATVRTANGNLKLIPYEVSNWGTIARQYGEERTESYVFGVRSTTSPRLDGVTVAIRDGSNRLKIIEYAVDPATMEITRPGSSALGTYVSVIAVDNIRRGRGADEPFYPSSGLFKGVVTAERRTSDGHLVVRTWAVSSSRDVTLTDTFDTEIDVSDVQIATVRGGTRDTVLVTAENSSGDLRALHFYVTRAGDLIFDDVGFAGEITALASTGVGSKDSVTAVSDSDGDLKLISLSFGNEIFRSGTRAAGNVTKVKVDLAKPTGEDSVLLNLIRTSSGGVKMLVFGSNFDYHM